jgi:hypothetical protein
MFRLLLTLLALLSGLVASTASAQPRIARAAGAEVASQLTDCDSHDLVTELNENRPDRIPGLQSALGFFAALYPAISIPSFLPGIDRAHE